jgi:hypothetical protein
LYRETRGRYTQQSVQINYYKYESHLTATSHVLLDLKFYYCFTARTRKIQDTIMEPLSEKV